MKKTWIAVAWLVAGITLAKAASGPNPMAPPFDLKRWDGSGSLSLRDLAGKIVVLDFFAYWCVPCQKASAELELNVQRHYEGTKGNPQGIPVQVVAVNVESEQRSKSEAFIRRNKLGLVVSDLDGKTLKAFEGMSLPHIVILDGSRATSEQPEFRIAYRKAGFDGVEKIRSIIDRLGEDRPRADKERLPLQGDAVRVQLDRLEQAGMLRYWAQAGPPPGGLESTELQEKSSEDGEGSHASAPSKRAAGSFEGLFASDVQLTQSSGSLRIARGDWEASVAGGVATIGLDYQPVDFDFLGTHERVEEARAFTQVSGRRRLLDSITVLAGGGLYDGFTDYRSAWLSEYYRQQFATLPGYVEPTPSGHNLSAGVRWEYLPATGFAQVDFSYLQDEVAPGYEIDFNGLRRGRSYLYTSIWKVSLENIVHRRVRLLHEIRRIDTSDRELRLGYQGAVNVALGERWTIRVQGGVSSEEPTFDAWYSGGTLEWEATDRWTVTASGRYYEDSGEIETSNFSNAAPPLKSWQVGLGMRYVTGGWAVKLFGAPYATRYGAFGIGTAFFGNLYRNRDWGLVQLAVDRDF